MNIRKMLGMPVMLALAMSANNDVPRGRNISDEVKQPLEVPKAFKNQPKPLSKKQKAKIKQCK